MKKLLLIPLLLFCVTAFGQWTKPQLYTNINTNIRLKTYSPTRMASLLDSLVESMTIGASMVYPGAGIPLSTGSAWGTSITDNSTNWNTAFGWGNHAGLYLLKNDITYLSALTGLNYSNANFSIEGSSDNNVKMSYSDQFTLRVGTQAAGGYGDGILLLDNTNLRHFYVGASGLRINVGSDATGDTYYRNSSGYLTRLPAGTNGYVLTMGASVPAWAALAYTRPEDYGAVGDGVTDDSTPIQSAVNSGKTVYFGNKTYLVSSSVTVPVNAHLKGSGSLSIIKTTSNIHIFEIDSINTTFENLTFLGNDTGTSQVGISAEGNSTITLHRYGNSVINCRFYDFGGSGLYGKNVMGAGSSSHRGGFYVTNSTFTSNRYGIHWDTQMEYNTVVNSTLTANTVGIYMGAAGNNSFSACNINDNTTGFQVVGGANDAHCVMDGSKLNHNTTAININGVGFGYLFSDCMIYSNPITIVNSTRIKFLGCDISTTSITSTSNTQLQFTNNRFYQTPTFTVTGSNPLFFNNTWDSGTLPSILNNTIVGTTTFTPTSTNAGIDVGSIASDPSGVANGQLWYNSTSNELKARINGSSVALGAGGGGGTVTSVGMTVPSFLSVSGSPVTTSGTLAVSWNGGTGVNTWLSTPSWTNLLSATTGTVPFWALASGGTATSANTFTANSPNYLTYTGTWTGTADGDAHRIYAGSITGSGTAAHSFYGDRYTPSLTAGANNQVLYGTYIAPTFATGGFTGTNPIALYVKGSTTVPGTSMILVGGGTNSASYNAFQTLDNAGSTLLSVRTDATVTHSAAAWAFTNTAFSTNSSSANQYLISHNRTPDDGGYALNLRSSATISSTSGARGRAQVLGGTFSPTSGSATETTFRVSETFNQTSTASGVITSLLIDPTVTSVTGSLRGIDYNPSSNPTTHLAFRATSGDVLIGATSITASTKFDIRGKGGAVTDNVLRLATSSNTEVFNFKENGHYNSGSYNERPLTGTASGTSFSETLYSSTEIADGESVTIEVLWTVKDSDTNTGAGGVFYTTWTKASGTLAKAGDNQLVTNNNTGDTFTVSTADSGGNISLTISSTGSSGNWKGNGQIMLIKKS